MPLWFSNIIIIFKLGKFHKNPLPHYQKKRRRARELPEEVGVDGG